ncbi:hypothetical protein BDF19DRAFT_436767 [Syncephalis fuscata]|nr:hypothetical protein BDF19DRAFT_436767 [Syncephalis fuscata]
MGSVFSRLVITPSSSSILHIYSNIAIMSWKGIKKGIARLPAMLKESSGRLEETHDAEYDYLVKQFNDFESSAQQLHKDATLYRDAVSSLMEHQQGFADTLLTLYQSALQRDIWLPPMEKDASSIEAIETTEKYAEIMRTTRNAIQPELEILTSTVITPILELNSVIKAIHKTTEKRERKRLDYDRHRASVKALNQRQERSLNDEKKLRQAELSTGEATEVFNAINGSLKQDLPKLLQMRGKFIAPCFISFYQLQLKISSMLDQQFQPLVSLRHIDYSHSAKDGYDMRKAQIDEILQELRSIAPQAMTVSRNASRSGVTPRTGSGAVTPITPTTPTTPSAPYDEKKEFSMRQNAHQFGGGAAVAPGLAPNRATPTATTATANTATPSPPRIVHPSSSEQYAVAVYPFVSETAGDLNFKKGERIRIVNKTESTNDWWTGRLYDKTGIFPEPPNNQLSPPSPSISPPPEYAAHDVAANTDIPAADANATTAANAVTAANTAGAVLPITNTRMDMPSPSIPNASSAAPAPNGNEIATALFDFNGDQPGDLPFKSGDKIEIIRRTEEPDGWWMGSLNGKKGTFPGNYVKM